MSKKHKPNPKKALEQKNYRLSIKDSIIKLTNQIESDPNIAKLYFDRAYSKNIIGDKKGAITDYTKGLEIEPANASILNDMGIIKIKVLDYRGALIDLNRAIELDPL